MGRNTALFKEVWHNRWMGEFHLDAVGRSGRKVVIWDKRQWKWELIGIVGQMLTHKLVGIGQNITWFLSVVYADCSRVIRKELWEELATIRNSCDGPWVVSGDFNTTRYPNERTASHSHSISPMTEFTDWINKIELFDPPLLGGAYIGKRGRIIQQLPELTDSSIPIFGRNCLNKSDRGCFLEWDQIIVQ
ncbi:hypothetical protein T459_35718 [Capsicum annuum]|uniref:Endonuclease/exonuclease/phosphatase domain-containing protein n=1 Tax=Capsicum annuum TaxID=4072 RepID=A0A2G2VCR0_CAPAN|nr:hypothetical protein T459_35718 [Capsicum annuum]